MIDPQGASLQEAFLSLTGEVTNDAAQVANTLASQSADAIARGATDQPNATLLDAALASQEQQPDSNAPPGPQQAQPGGPNAANGLPSYAQGLTATGAPGAPPGISAIAADLAAAFAQGGTGAQVQQVAQSIATLMAQVQNAGIAGLRDPEVVRGLAMLLTNPQSAASALGVPAALAQVLAILRQALTAPPGAVPEGSLEALANLASSSPEEVRSAAAAARQAAALAPQSGATNGTPLGLPIGAGWAAEEARRRAAAGTSRAERSREAGAIDDRAAVLAIPERDAAGKPYDAASRARLADLGRDPRRGFAPEAAAAHEAERETCLVLARAAGTEHDFVADDGAAWSVLAPREALGFEAALRALSQRANAIVTFRHLTGGDRVAVAAAVARLAATAGARRIVLVETDA